MKARLAKLIDVKTIVTFALTIVHQQVPHGGLGKNYS